LNTLIFDLDGTLVNTIGDIALSMNRALEAHGFKALPTEAYPPLVGWGIKRLAYNALPEDSRFDAMVEAVSNDALDFYAQVPLRYSVPYPGITTLLEGLTQRGYPLAVLTNKPDPVARSVVAGLFPDIPFVLVRGDVAGEPRKPAPVLTLNVMARMGATAASTLFVGDSAVDVETAHGVSCPVVGVSWGFRGREELEISGADYIIDHPDHLWEILDSLAP
jgi:phosphoglycolate phosphatase